MNYCARKPCNDKNAYCINLKTMRECYCYGGFRLDYNNKCFGKIYVKI